MATPTDQLTEYKLQVLSDKIDELATDIRCISAKLDTTYVKKSEFGLVRTIVFGACSVILLAFIGFGASSLWPSKMISVEAQTTSHR